MYPPPRPGFAPYPMGGPPPYGANYPPGPYAPGGPQGGMYGPPGAYPGGLRPPSRTRPPGVPPPKSTTLWVGKIAPSVEGSVMRSLLEACGEIREWKPVTDADTGRLKGFGFCTYEKPEGAVLALRVLNNLNVDGQELALKCNKATEEYVEWYKGHKEALEARAAAEGLAVEEGAGGPDENAVLERVMSIISGRAAVAPKADTAAAANDFLASLGKDGAGEGREERRQTDRKRERDQEEADRERQRQRREEQRKQEQEERAFRDALREWEEHERTRQREAERERDRASDLLKERSRQIRADNEAADSDEEEEPWARKFYKSSRRAANRRRRREAELAEDRALQAAEEAAVAAALAAEMEEVTAGREAGEAAADYDDSDAIYQAMMKAAVSAKTGEPQPVRRKVVKAAFGEEDEEETPQRKLIPIQYTQEEQQAWQLPDAGEAAGQEEGAGGEGAGGAAAPSGSGGKLDLATLKKELMATIPKDQAGVFAFGVKWEFLDRAPPDVRERVAGWVSKKIKDLMGEEEASFCEFIMTQVTSHVGAGDMLGALRDVLDEDADAFVTKLFQVLIYETEKLARLGA